MAATLSRNENDREEDTKEEEKEEKEKGEGGGELRNLAATGRRMCISIAWGQPRPCRRA